MSDCERIPLAEAQDLANAVVNVLKPVCQRVEIAGSIRRKKADIGDIEIVCIPNEVEVGLFGETDYDVKAVYNALKEHGYMPFKGGSKYIACRKFGTQYDVFVATRETWGCVFMIRTGSAEFSRKMVTKKLHGGYCPHEYYFFEGRLRSKSGTPIDTPEEIDVFNVLGLDYIEPEKRY